MTRVAPLQWGATHGMICCKTMCEHSLRKTRRHIKKATKQQQTNKQNTKQRSVTHCDVRHGTSCCDVRRAGGCRGSNFSGDSYKSIVFCSIRCGGRGSGGVILYEKKIATAKERSTRHGRQLSERFGDIL